MLMKKLFLSLVMMLTATSAAWAQYVEQDGLWFSLHDTNPKYAQVEEPESGSYSGEINIPSVVSYGGEDYPVTYIGWNAFKESAVTKVTIPSSVTHILGSAFQGCASLTEVNLSEGLEYISSYVFQGSAVTSLTIPGTVTSIQTFAMEAMTSLTKLTFAYGTEELALDWTVFNGTNNVTELVVDRYYTFGNGNGISYSTVKKVTFGEHLTTIPYSVCQGMSLNELNVGANVTAIDRYAFADCTLPEGYNFPFTQIKEIKEGAFYPTKNLPANLDLSGVETIESMAFANCAIQTVKLGSSLTTLGNGAFSYCDQLTAINIPGSINSFTAATFQYCTALTNVTFDYGSTALTLEDGTFSYATNLTIDRTISGTTPFSTTAVTKVALGSHMASTSAIQSLNLSQYTGLTELELLEGWTTVPSNAFMDIATVTTLTLPNGLKTIGYQAFSGCTGLTSVNLPDGLETIGDGAFRNCTATFNGVPSTVTSIGQSAFSGCTGLTGALVVPAGVTQLGGSTFSGTGITSVTIPGTVTTISQSDFGNCANLTSVTLLSGENKLTIGKRCFYNSNNITDVTIDRDFTYYNDLEKNRSPFNTAIERVTFGSNVTRVGDRALASCRSLKDVVLPDNITTIGVEAFKWSEPQTLTLSKNLTTVEDYGFYGMIGSALPTLTLPMNMSAVGKQAYYDIPNLTGVYVPWIDPLFALANDTESEKTFSYATNQTLWIPGGTLASYQAADGWKRFQNFDYWSFVVNATVAGKGQLDVANGEAVHANGTNTAKSVTGTQLVEAGAGETVSGLFVREKDVTFTSTPARGYELSSLTANGTDVKAAGKVANLLADQNIAAEFTPIIYNITYNNLLNGVVDPANPATYTVEDAAITLANPTRTGYTFEGWTGTDIEGTAMEVTIAASSIGDREYTATWKPIVYDITYDLAGGSVATPNPDKYTIETADFTLTNPTKLGYTFLGWTGTDLAEPTTEVLIAKGSTGDRSYTATWKANTYKVSFKANGGEGEMADQPFTYDEAAKALTANAFTRTGYTYKGWNTKADGSGTAYEDGQEVQNLTSKADDTVTLYAQWEVITYAISYDLDGGTVDGENPTAYTAESTFTLLNPTKEGYDFTGWTGTGLDKPTMTVVIAKGSTGDRAYKATWELKQYAVTIETTENGTVEASTLTPKHGEQVVITVTPDEGCKLVSLTVNGEDVTEQVVDGKYTIESVTADVTVTAVFAMTLIAGDVNGDGTVGIGDIVAVTNVMAGIEQDGAVKARADVNHDGEVGIGDIVAITNIMAGL